MKSEYENSTRSAKFAPTIALTYEVDPLRSLTVICGATTYEVPLDLVVLLATTALLVMAAAMFCPKVGD